MSVSDETLAELEAQRAAMLAALAGVTDYLAVAWARAWDELAADLAEAIEDVNDGKPGSLARARRARAALAIVSEQLTILADRAAVNMSQAAAAAIRQALTDQPLLFGSQLPDGVGIRWNEPDARQIRAMIERTTATIHARTLGMSRDAEVAMKRELGRAVAMGSNPNRAAQLMLARVQGVFDGGLTRATVIARTEIMDAYRAAAAAAEAENADVLVGWQWVATLSDRTCPSCIAMHGTMHKLTEPGPIDHHQGRCARMPVTKPWAELGIDAPEPPSAIPSAADWWARLSAGEQRQILGNARMDAHLAGRFPMSRWPMRVKTPGWRDSMHTRPAPPRRSAALAS